MSLTTLGLSVALCLVLLAFGLYVRSTRRELRQLRAQAMEDALTGLYNRGAFDRLLRAMYNEADRYETPLGILFVDLDRFKLINDELGHAAGDMALKVVADALRKSARNGDLIARIGDEFVVAARLGFTVARGQPTAPEVGIEVLAKHLWEGLKGCKIQGRAITVSVGATVLAPHRHPDDTVALALQRADEALYEVKNNGRNGVRIKLRS